MEDNCLWCGKPFSRLNTGRPRLYHNDVCREMAYRSRKRERSERAWARELQEAGVGTFDLATEGDLQAAMSAMWD